MREFFKSWKFRILAGVALLVIGIMLRAATSGGFSSYTEDAVAFLTKPFAQLSSIVSNAVTNFLAGFTNYGAVVAENKRLTKENEALTSKVVDYDRMALQNQQYSEFLGLKQEHPDFQFQPARVISRGTDQWYSSFTIDKGSLDGIAANDPVITSAGLVGQVYRVTQVTAVVVTIIDPSIQVGALISSTGDTCLTQGDRLLVSKGQLGVVNIPRESLVAEGDIIITPGNGGVYPGGLRIATIRSVKLEDSVSKYAVAEPMTDISKLTNVFVITDFRGKDLSGTSSSGSSAAASPASQP